jgi:acyl carrier protein
MNVEETIKQFISEEILFGENSGKLDPNESLLRNGTLDSMALLRLVAFIEERFNVTVDDGELIPDNFETVNLINDFVEMKRQASTPS